MQNNTVYNIFNAPKGKDSPHGEHVYEWEYLDEDGKVQKDKQDVFEKIQSYVSRVDYKAQIARGEMELDGTLENVSRDYRGLPDNTVDYYKYLSMLANLPKEQVAKLMESTNQGNKDIVQKEQTANQTSAPGAKVDSELNANQSKNSTSITNINGEGDK